MQTPRVLNKVCLEEGLDSEMLMTDVFQFNVVRSTKI